VGRGILLVLVTLASGLLLYLLLAPRFLSSPGPTASNGGGTPPPINASSASASGASGANASAPPGNGTPAPPAANVESAPAVVTPRSSQQRETDDRESKRSPFYRWIRENMKDALVGWQASSQDPATLELYSARDDPDVVTQLLASVVQPYAAHYGFNHVLFYVPNPAGSIEHYRLSAEAQYEDGVWKLFAK